MNPVRYAAAAIIVLLAALGAQAQEDFAHLSGRALGHDTVALSWQGQKHYNGPFYVRRWDPVNRYYRTVAKVDSWVSTYEDTGLQPATTYYYDIAYYYDHRFKDELDGVLLNWGTGTQTGGFGNGGGVPEPATVVLAAFFAVLFAAIRCGRSGS